MPPKDIRVLLVDDEEDLVEYLSRRLQREGFTVRAVTSGEDAVEAVSQEDFDVAIVDLRMAGLDGVETQKRIKELRPLLQTIVLTGHASVQTALQSGQFDAFMYMEKPAEHDALVKAIQDAAKKKYEAVYRQMQDELQRMTGAYSSPRDILNNMESLRKKWGLD